MTDPNKTTVSGEPADIGSTRAAGSTIATGSTVAGDSTVAAGSTVASGSTVAGNSTVAAGSTIASGSTVAAGSTVSAGSTVAAGSARTAAAAQATAVMSGSSAGMTAVANATAVAPAAGKAGDSAHKATFDLTTRKDITIGKNTYIIDKLIGNGGEAEVYVLVKDGRKYALKLYRGVHQFNKDLIGRLAKLRGKAAITDIYGYGNIKIGGETRSFTLMEYCPDGSTASWDFKGNGDAILQIVTLAARNLNELHKAGIIHKDTKPDNLLFTDKGSCLLLLSDFGISDILDADGSVNTPQSRTPIYAGPEIYTKASLIGGTAYAIMTKAYDYYALGMTALALWSGVDSFKRKETELVKLKREGKIEVPKQMPEPLRTIVRGLLVQDPEQRWGFDEIQRKLSGEDVPVGESIGTIHVVFDSSKNKIARTTAELARFMMEDQQLGISYLYKGRVCEWLRKTMPEVEIKINDIIESKYPKDQVAGLYAAALLLDPELPYYDRKGKSHDTLIPLLNAEDSFSNDLTNPANPVYIYLRHSQGEAWTDALLGRVKAAAGDQFGYARSVLVWGVHDTDIYRTFYGKKEATDQKFAEVQCHNPMDVLNFFSAYRTLSDDDKKFVCSLGFAEMVRTFAPDDAAKVEKVRRDNASAGFQTLFRLIIQTLNPAADVNLCADPKDPWYAMTGAGLGKLINMAFNAYYVQFDGDRDRLYKEWTLPDNPYRNISQASTVDLIIMSFKGDWTGSYLHKSFLTKGNRFDAQDKWAVYCTSYKSTDNVKKYGPYDVPIAIMKAISGFGHTPEYRFKESGETVRSLSDFNKLLGSRGLKDEIARSLRTRSLHAWLAVQYQENPHADLKPKYAYEKLTQQYVGMLGKCDPDNREYKRYRSAYDSVSTKGKGQPILALGAIQNVFVALCSVLFLAALGTLVVSIIQAPWLAGWDAKTGIFILFGPVLFCLLLCQFFSEDRILGFFSSIIFYVIAMIVLYFVSRWFIWRLVPYLTLAATGLFAWYFLKQLYQANYGASELRAMKNPDYEQLTLEPLHFAFKSSDSSFKSSFASNEDFYKDQYKESLKDKVRPVILGCITGFILMINALTGYGIMTGNDPEKIVDSAATSLVTGKSGGSGEADGGNGGGDAGDAEPAAASENSGGTSDDAGKSGKTKAAATTAAATGAAAAATENQAGATEAPGQGTVEEAAAAQDEEDDNAGQPSERPAGVPAMSASLSAAKGITVSCDTRQVIDGSGVFSFELTNGSGSDMTPFIVIEEPSANIVSLAEAIDNNGRSYSAVDGEMSVTIDGTTMDAAHRDPVFRFNQNQTVRGTVNIKNLDKDATSIEIRIPFREFNPDAYPYRRGYLIIKNIPVSQ